VLLEVRDTGIGMDERTKKHLFDPFFTTKGLARDRDSACRLFSESSPKAAGTFP